MASIGQDSPIREQYTSATPTQLQLLLKGLLNLDSRFCSALCYNVARLLTSLPGFKDLPATGKAIVLREYVEGQFRMRYGDHSRAAAARAGALLRLAHAEMAATLEEDQKTKEKFEDLYHQIGTLAVFCQYAAETRPPGTAEEPLLPGHDCDYWISKYGFEEAIDPLGVSRKECTSVGIINWYGGP